MRVEECQFQFHFILPLSEWRSRHRKMQEVRKEVWCGRIAAVAQVTFHFRQSCRSPPLTVLPPPPTPLTSRPTAFFTLFFQPPLNLIHQRLRCVRHLAECNPGTKIDRPINGPFSRTVTRERSTTHHGPRSLLLEKTQTLPLHPQQSSVAYPHIMPSTRTSWRKSSLSQPPQQLSRSA